MQHVLFVLGGFTVVMSILALLAGTVALLGRLFVAREKRPPSAPVPAPEPAAPGIPPHHLAAIAAAVAAITGGRGRVVHVAAPPHRAPAWAQHSRAVEFASHRVRWDWTVPNPPNLDPPRTERPESKP